MGGSNQSTWGRLVEIVGLPELAEDPRFLENADRMRHVDELASILGERFKTRSTAEWLGLLEGAGSLHPAWGVAVGALLATGRGGVLRRPAGSGTSAAAQ